MLFTVFNSKSVAIIKIRLVIVHSVVPFIFCWYFCCFIWGSHSAMLRSYSEFYILTVFGDHKECWGLNPHSSVHPTHYNFVLVPSIWIWLFKCFTVISFFFLKRILSYMLSLFVINSFDFVINRISFSRCKTFQLF